LHEVPNRDAQRSNVLLRRAMLRHDKEVFLREQIARVYLPEFLLAYVFSCAPL
jgi:hypothetical protein